MELLFLALFAVSLILPCQRYCGKRILRDHSQHQGIGCTDQCLHELLESDGHYQAYEFSGECRIIFIFHLFLPMPLHQISGL